MRRVAHRVRPRESGCPIHKEQMTSPRRLGASAVHTRRPQLPGRSLRQRVDLANDDDDLKRTLVLPATAPGAAADGPGRPHTDLEARLERLFTRGRDLAGTIIRPEVDILEMASSRPPKRTDGNILTMVPDWHNRPVIMQLALGALAVCNLRPSGCTLFEEVNIL